MQLIITSLDNHTGVRTRGLRGARTPPAKKKQGAGPPLKSHVYRQEVDTDCVWHGTERDWSPSNNKSGVLEKSCVYTGKKLKPNLLCVAWHRGTPSHTSLSFTKYSI